MSEARAPRVVPPVGQRLGPVLLTVVVDLLGFGLVIPLLSFYAETYGATPGQVTGLMACYSIAQFLGAPLWGQLSDRVGRRPVMLVSIAGTAISLAGFAAAPSLGWLFVWRTLNGACAANISTAQAYVADITTPENRARGMGLIGASFGVGFSMGPWLGGELSRYGLAAPIWAAAALATANFLWAAVGLPESHPIGDRARSERTIDPRALLRALIHPQVGRVLALAFAATAAFAMMESTFSLVAEHAWTMNATQVGRVFGVIGVIGVLIQGGLIGRLAKRIGESTLVRSGYALNALGLALLAGTGGGAGVWLGCAVIAVGSSLANPSLSSLLTRAAHPSERGTVLGVNQSLGALGRAIGPAVGGVLYAHWFHGAAFLAGAVVLVVALGIAGSLGRAPAPAPSAGERG